MKKIEVSVTNNIIHLPKDFSVNNEDKVIVIALSKDKKDKLIEIRKKLSKVPYSISQKLVDERGWFLAEYFLDTSTWIKRYSGEPEAEKVDKIIEGHSIAILDLEIPELISNLFRLFNENHLTDEELEEILSIVYSDIANLTIVKYKEKHLFDFEYLCRKMRQTAIDGMILLCAKELDNITILTSDKRLKAGAELEGLKVEFI